MTTKRVAIYGGAFDPCHIAHFIVITQVLNSRLVDEVWVFPSGDRPDKSYNANDAARLSMLKLGVGELFKDDERVKIRTDHLEKETGHSSIELLERLEKEHENYTFSLVVGSELIRDLPQWHESKKLLQKAKFLVVARAGTAKTELPGASLSFLPNPHSLSFFISSTELRLMLKKGDSLAGLIPASVLRYIKEHKLYV